MLSYGKADIERIAEAMGHRNSIVTRKTYRHAMGDQVSTAAEVWDALEVPQAPKFGSQGGHDGG